MFDFRHYVPILRWKAAEKEAIKFLEPKSREKITPLVEFIMPSGEWGKETTLEESIDLFKSKISKIPYDLQKYWGETPLFVDFHYIDVSIRAGAMKTTLDSGKKLGLFLIPVVNLVPVIDIGSDDKTLDVVANYSITDNKGFCLRLTTSDLNEKLISSIEKLLQKTKVPIKEVDLIIDFLIVEAAPNYELFKNIPNLQEWRTFTIASGAFPPDLTKFSTPDLYRIPRSDWQNWEKLNKILQRKASFSDYTIQHPIYKEPISRANPSASIRYATQEEWVIMKGQGIYSDNSAGHAQYPAQAKLLCQQNEFKAFGENFSYGDNYIAEIAKAQKNTGNPRTWLRAGINHHLTCTADQLSNFS